MFGNLFLFTDPVNYNIALNMLSGSVYANYLNSFPSLGVHENDLPDHATNCEIPALAGSVLECRSSLRSTSGVSSTIRPGRPMATTRPARAARSGLGALGIDFSVGNSAIFGVECGLSSEQYPRQPVRRQREGQWLDCGRLCGLRSGCVLREGRDHLQLAERQLDAGTSTSPGSPLERPSLRPRPEAPT